MKLQEVIQLTFVASLVLMGAGCSALQNFSAGQEWSSNYALMEGAQANDPAIIDGNLKTVGQTQYVESSMSGEDNYIRTMATYAAPSEAVVILPEPKAIHRVVIHSANVIQMLDIWITDSNGKWEKVKEVKSNKENKIDIRLTRTIHTAGVRARIRRTADDAALRRKNVRRGFGYRQIGGKTKAQAKIAEFELYGFVTGTEPGAAASEVKDDEAELDLLLSQ